MRVTQGAFSFLPDLTDDQIHSQVQYCIDNGWAVSLEYTDDPHPRNTYWDMWGHPMFDNPDAAAVIYELNECRKIHGNKSNQENMEHPKTLWKSRKILVRIQENPGKQRKSMKIQENLRSENL